MPQIAEIKVTDDNEVWCKVILLRNTDVCGTISLFTPEEIEEVKRKAIRDFLNHQFESFMKDTL